MEEKRKLNEAQKVKAKYARLLEPFYEHDADAVRLQDLMVRLSKNL